MTSFPDLSSGPPRYELRPSPLRQFNDGASDEVVPAGENPPGIGDFLQALNPLQHLPLIGTAYRALTGATIEPAARVVGGLLFGGPFGMVSSLVNAVIAETSGGDIGDHMLAMVGAGKVPGAPVPPLPPSLPDKADDAGAFLHFASLAGPAGNPGGIERGGLLTTWTAARPHGGEQWVRAEPSGPVSAAGPGAIPLREYAPRGPAVETAQAAVVAPTPIAAAAPAPAEAPAPAAIESLRPAGRGKSLQDYRSVAVVPAAFSAPAPSAVDSLGLNRRAETARKLAVQTQSMHAATLQAQQAAGEGPAAPQNYFSAAMLAGLERYRDMQRRRDAAATPDAI